MIKKFTKIDQEEGDHLESYGGEQVLLKCMNYFYHGVLSEVNDESVKLDNAYVVFNTGDYSSLEYEDKQALPNGWCVMKQAIESFGVLKVITSA